MCCVRSGLLEVGCGLWMASQCRLKRARTWTEQTLQPEKDARSWVGHSVSVVDEHSGGLHLVGACWSSGHSVGSFRGPLCIAAAGES